MPSLDSKNDCLDWHDIYYNGNQFREVGGGICSSTAVPILVFLIMMKNQMNGVQNTQVPGREITVLTNLEWHTF